MGLKVGLEVGELVPGLEVGTNVGKDGVTVGCDVVGENEGFVVGLEVG